MSKLHVKTGDTVVLLTGDKKDRKKTGKVLEVSPKEGNFNAFASNSEKRKQRKFIRLAHGSASVGDEDVRMHLRISRREAEVMPAQVICKESEIAGEFVTKNC